VQRERYDEQRAAEMGDDVDESGTEVAVVGAKSRATGARRGPAGTTVEVEAGSANGSGTRGAAGTKAPPPPKVPTIELPEGLVQAPTRARSYAMALDFSVLVVIFILVYWIGGTLIKDQYPAETHRIDRLSDQSTAADKAKSNADDAKDKANSALDKAKKGGDSDKIAAAQDKAKAATAKANAAEKKSKQVADDLTKAQSKLRTPYLLVYLAILVLSLLYCVPMSVRTGQTFGKRLRHVRLVRIDGSAPGWSSSLIHYGLPIFLTLALIQVLGPLAIILGLGCVLWNLRDRNRQGVHDKLAKTFVVEA
jgi:F0F1-type ATP synthase membrane subunit b/b'